MKFKLLIISMVLGSTMLSGCGSIKLDSDYGYLAAEITKVEAYTKIPPALTMISYKYVHPIKSEQKIEFSHLPPNCYQKGKTLIQHPGPHSNLPFPVFAYVFPNKQCSGTYVVK